MAYTVEVKESDGLRTLHFGSAWMQGAMRIDSPFDERGNWSII